NAAPRPSAQPSAAASFPTRTRPPRLAVAWHPERPPPSTLCRAVGAVTALVDSATATAKPPVVGRGLRSARGQGRRSTRSSILGLRLLGHPAQGLDGLIPCLGRR